MVENVLRVCDQNSMATLLPLVLEKQGCRRVILVPQVTPLVPLILMTSLGYSPGLENQKTDPAPLLHPNH